MNIKRMSLIILLLPFLFCAFSVQKADADDLIIVATPSAQKVSQSWLDFLMTKEVSFKAVSPEEFDNYKLESYIVIMGGLNESGGIKKIIKDALSDEEISQVSQAGKGGMYLKSNKWAMGQQVMVLAGYDQSAALKARTDNKDAWFETLSKWFGLEEGVRGLHAY